MTIEKESTNMTATFSVSKVLLLIAIILFVLTAFGVQFGPANLLPIGLAFFASSFLVP